MNGVIQQLNGVSVSDESDEMEARGVNEVRSTSVHDDDSLFVADSLDEGLAWCEDLLIKKHLPTSNTKDPYSDNMSLSQKGNPLPKYLRQLYALCPQESHEVVDKLFAKFRNQSVKGDTILW